MTYVPAPDDITNGDNKNSNTDKKDDVEGKTTDATEPQEETATQTDAATIGGVDEPTDISVGCETTVKGSACLVLVLCGAMATCFVPRKKKEN